MDYVGQGQGHTAWLWVQLAQPLSIRALMLCAWLQRFAVSSAWTWSAAVSQSLVPPPNKQLRLRCTLAVAADLDASRQLW